MALLLLALAPPAAAAPREDWRPGVRKARAYAKSRAGTVAFAVRTPGRHWGLRGTWTMPSASVVKAMLMVAYLRQRGVRRRALSDEARGLLGPMIRWSDNAAASQVRNIVGNGALVSLARHSHMRRFAPAGSWGSSQICANDQSLFFMRIERLIPRRHRRYALRLLARIVPSQRWGIARARPSGWRLHFKGGWGSGSGAVDHQVGLLRQGERRVAIAVLTVGNPSHAYGTETLRGVAKRLLRGLRVRKERWRRR